MQYDVTANTQPNRFMNSIPAGFVGVSMLYKDFMDAVIADLDSDTALPAGTGASSCEWLPQGWLSALVVSSNTQASNHVILVGAFEQKPGSMAVYDVLGAVLTAKYMLP